MNWSRFLRGSLESRPVPPPPSPTFIIPAYRGYPRYECGFVIFLRASSLIMMSLFHSKLGEITVDESWVQSQLAIMSGVNPINLLYYHRNSMANARSSWFTTTRLFKLLFWYLMWEKMLLLLLVLFQVIAFANGNNYFLTTIFKALLGRETRNRLVCTTAR